jgi:hypothetical protein
METFVGLVLCFLGATAVCIWRELVAIRKNLEKK